MKEIVLASSSKYRKELLNKLGLPFKSDSPEIDEDYYKNKYKDDPKYLCLLLSKLKAQKIFEKYKNALVIGSDQLGHLEGEILGKPQTIENAFLQLKKMMGKTHELITSVTIISEEKTVSFTDITRLTMKNLTDKQIKFYLRQDNPIDCAGSYKLEMNGISLFSKIETNDQSAIIGLPLLRLAEELETWGLKIPAEF